MADSRKTERAAIATLLSSNIGELVEVYDHETKNIGGLSPVAMVHSDGTSPPTTFSGDRVNRYIISLFWKRTDDDATEDYMDDLSEAVFDLLESQTTLPTLVLADEFSSLDYPFVEETQYRREMIRVEV